MILILILILELIFYYYLFVIFLNYYFVVILIIIYSPIISSLSLFLQKLPISQLFDNDKQFKHTVTLHKDTIV